MSSGNNITAWQWNFGDGSANSTLRNPVHTFTNTGTTNVLYTVTLTAFNDGGSNTITRVDYVNVSPSPLKTFHISLYEGWNIISVPLIPQQSGVTDVFPASAMDDIEVIWMYNTSQASPWSYYTPRTDIYEQGTLTTIDEKHGYYVYCNNDTSFDVSGALTDEALTLSPGWNLIGNPTMATRAPWDVYSGFEVIWEYDPSQASPWSYNTPRTDIYEQGSLTSLKPGFGYLIYV
jgi:PKD repeat protein